MRAWTTAPFAVALVAAGVARGQDSTEEDEPTAYACTLDTLRSEAKCFLEASDKPRLDARAQAAENLRAAAASAPAFCADAATVQGEQVPDPRLEKRCEQALRDAAARECVLNGGPMLDAQGRFSKSSGACYRALGQALRTIRLMAAWSVPCCRCIERACSLSNDQCNDSLVTREPSTEIRQCLAHGVCQDACEDFVPVPANDTKPDPAPAAPKGTRRTTLWY